MQKTVHSPKDTALAERKWHVIDVKGMTLGRAATQIAHLLRGKHKATWSPHVDGGDFVIVVNAASVHLTGKKMQGKLYHTHTLFPGGLVTMPAEEMLRRRPTEPVKRAVWGMLPKGRLGRKLYRKLKVYAKAEHPHAAQQPAATKLAAAR